MRSAFPISWKRVLKIAGVFALAAFLLFGIASWLLFRQRNTLVLEQIQASLDQSQSGQLTIGNIDLGFFRQFPNISIELDSVTYFEHHDSLRSEEESPIFRAERIYVALAMWPLLNNRVEVSEINVSGGQINLVEYAPGVYNIHRALAKPRHVNPHARPTTPSAPLQTPPTPPTKKQTPHTPPSPKGSSPPLSLKLDYVLVSDVRLSWLPFRRSDQNSVQVIQLEAGLSQAGSRTEISLRSQFHLDTVQFRRTSLPSGDLSFDAEGEFDNSTERLVIRETRLSLDVFSIAASGSYDHGNNGLLDLELNAASNDLPLLEKLLRQEVIQNSRDLLRSGDLYIKGKLFGELRKQSPQFDLIFGARNLSFRLPGARGAFKDLGFEGHLVSGAAADYSTASLEIKQLKGQIPGGFILGDIRITNAVYPSLKCSLQAEFAVDDFDKVFQTGGISELKGTVSTHIRFDGPLRMPWPGNKGPKAKFDADFSVSRLSFLLARTAQRFEDVGCKGTFSSGKNPDLSEAILEISGLKARVPGGKLMGNMRMTNLAEPVLHYRVAADVNLEGYDQVFQLKELRGRASADLRFDGPLALIGTHAMDSSRSSVLRLDSVSFWHQRSKRKISGLQASLTNVNNLASLVLAFRLGDSDLRLEAKVENLMHRIFGKERIVQASGMLKAQQLFTRDIILDSLRLPIVDDRISELSFDFQLRNVLDRDDTVTEGKQFQFRMQNLAARFDQLPDIRNLDALGTFKQTPEGLSMDLNDLNLDLPQGKVSVSGGMLIPSKRQLEAHARIRLTDFPWAYVGELVAEIRQDAEPSKKHLPVNETDKVTAELDVAASLRTYPFDFRKLEINNSRIRYAAADNKVYAVDRIDVALEPLSFVHPPHSGAIVGLRSARGTFAVRGLKVPGLIDLNAAFTLQAASDTLHADFISTSRKAAQEGGFIFLNLSGAEPLVRLRYDVVSTPVDALIERFSNKKFLSGDISYSLALQTAGKTWADARKNLQGAADIRSDSLDLYGVDIDDALTKFEKSQKFNLTDLGAVVLVGPVGIVATKGSDFVALATIDVNNRQKTHIRQLAATWKLEHQLLETTDVAFATRQNRIAFDGAIDFERDSIPGIRVAVIDKNGCSLMDQRLYGKFSAIKKGKLNIAKTLLGSVINFMDAIVGKDCAPIYTGKVKDPKSGNK